jgi:hypothetical protein
LIHNDCSEIGDLFSYGYIYEGNSKIKVPIFYLNKVTTYRVTHEAEVQSISFTSPNSHEVCLYTYHSDISICQLLHRKKCVLDT